MNHAPGAGSLARPVDKQCLRMPPYIDSWVYSVGTKKVFDDPEYLHFCYLVRSHIEQDILSCID